MSQPLRYGAVGASITLTAVDQDGAVIDISTATLASSLYLRSPGGRLLIKTPGFVTDGTNGQIYYDTIAGDLNEVGAWQAQFKLTMGSDVLPSEVIPVQVQPNIFP